MIETYRKIHKKDMDEIMSSHQEWLKSGGRKGRKADLCMVDLSGFDLQELNLKRADLVGSNFDGANLIGTILEEADLQETSLNNARGIIPNQLAGANVCGAQLPEKFSWDERLKSAGELSKKAAKLFILLLAICAYTLLTIATTTDARLLTNSATSTLPFINSQIPIVYFYISIPPLILGLFLWFHLYLIRIWDILSMLPAFFPNGDSVDKKIYPWLPIEIVRYYFYRLKNYHPIPIFYRIQRWLTIVSAWIVAPATLFMIWFIYLKRQDIYWSYFHAILLMVIIAFSISFYKHMKSILTARVHDCYFLNYKRPWRLLFILALGYVFCLISFSSISDNYYFDKETKISKKLVPGVLDIIGLPRSADISGQQVSVKYSDEEKPNSIQGAYLKGRKLRYCRAVRAFLASADLRFANLYNAYFSEANLRWANLRHAQMNKCYFVGADLRDSDLSFSSLQDADLSEADCKKGNFGSAILKRAIMVRSNLEDANLKNANLEEAVLFCSNLQNADLRRSNLIKANLGGFHPARIRLSDYGDYFPLGVTHEIIEDFPEGTILDKKYWMNFEGSINLQEANLKEANLSNAKLMGANLKGANLTDTNLKGADLTGARGLTLEQIKSAIIDDRTKLPDYLKKD